MPELEVSKTKLLEEIITSIEKIQDTQASIIEETEKISEHNLDPEAHPFINTSGNVTITPSKKEIIYVSELPDSPPEDLADGGLLIVINSPVSID